MNTTSRDQAMDVDVAVIGSGFGGSVAALRLAEKGYDVVVLEAGARIEHEDFINDEWDSFAQLAWKDARTTSGEFGSVLASRMIIVLSAIASKWSRHGPTICCDRLRGACRSRCFSMSATDTGSVI